MKTRFLAGIGALFFLALAGCNATAPVGVQQTALAKAIPTPKPTPTPHPLEKYIQAHRIPAWAQGKVLNDVPVKPGDKPFALTFDDGPWPEYTEQILAILAQHDAKATFYMVGQMVQEYPQLAVKVRDAGHAIGNHSWSHPSRPKDAVAQIQKTNAQIKKAVGFTPTTFRPPYGLLKNGMAREAMKQKQAVLIWSADSNDWRKPNPERMARTIINQATPGGVALFHDGGGARQNTVRALPIILRELKAKGYHFVTVPELLHMRYIAPPKPKALPGQKKPDKPSLQSTKKAKNP